MRRTWMFVWIVFGIFFLTVPKMCYAEDRNGALEKREGEESDTAEMLLSELELSQVQDMLDALLAENSFSIKDTLGKMIQGEEVFSKEAVQKILHSFFFGELEKEKALFGKLIVLILMAAIFSNFAAVFESGQIGEMCFYVVYLLLFVLLMDSFKETSQSLEQTLSWMSEFMRGLAPAFFLTVSVSSGAASAAVFYEGVLLLTWLVQWVLVNMLLPAADLYVLLSLISHLSKEEMLEKMTELLNTIVRWGVKTLLGVVAGLQFVRGLVSPVMDSLKRSLAGKAASALPGIGNAVNVVTEVVLTSAVLVRNCFGVVILLILAAVGIMPLLHCGVLSLGYRFLSAVSQPISDKRMTACLTTMGESYSLLLQILIAAEILSMLDFVVLMIGVGGIR